MRCADLMTPASATFFAIVAATLALPWLLAKRAAELLALLATLGVFFLLSAACDQDGYVRDLQSRWVLDVAIFAAVFFVSSLRVQAFHLLPGSGGSTDSTDDTRIIKTRYSVGTISILAGVSSFLLLVQQIVALVGPNQQQGTPLQLLSIALLAPWLLSLHVAIFCAHSYIWRRRGDVAVVALLALLFASPLPFPAFPAFSFVSLFFPVAEAFYSPTSSLESLPLSSSSSDSSFSLSFLTSFLFNLLMFLPPVARRIFIFMAFERACIVQNVICIVHSDRAESHGESRKQSTTLQSKKPSTAVVCATPILRSILDKSHTRQHVRLQQVQPSIFQRTLETLAKFLRILFQSDPLLSSSEEVQWIKDLQHARTILHTASKSFSTACILFPQPLRLCLIATYALARMADDVADDAMTHRTEKAERLWRIRVSLEKMYAGRKFDKGADAKGDMKSESTAPASHDVDDMFASKHDKHEGASTPLPGPMENETKFSDEQVRVLRCFAPMCLWIPFRAIDELLEGFRWDLEKRDIATNGDLFQYCAHVASSVGEMCTRLIFAYEKTDGFLCSHPSCTEPFRTDLFANDQPYLYHHQHHHQHQCHQLEPHQSCHSHHQHPGSALREPSACGTGNVPFEQPSNRPESSEAKFIEAARKAGTALQLVNIARDIVHDAQDLGRIYIPSSWLTQEEQDVKYFATAVSETDWAASQQQAHQATSVQLPATSCTPSSSRSSPCESPSPSSFSSSSSSSPSSSDDDDDIVDHDCRYDAYKNVHQDHDARIERMARVRSLANTLVDMADAASADCFRAARELPLGFEGPVLALLCIYLEIGKELQRLPAGSYVPRVAVSAKRKWLLVLRCVYFWPFTSNTADGK